MQHILVILCILSSSQAVAVSRHVIYGEDDRIEVHKANDTNLKEMSKSVLLLGKRSSLIPYKGDYKLSSKSAGEVYSLCPEEPFRYQQWGGHCTGFLGTSNRVVTAGHCLNQAPCSKTVFIFDYAYYRDTPSKPFIIKKENVYYCKKLIKRKIVFSRDVDFAILELDRPVLDRPPLPLRKEGKIAMMTPLAAIGHSLGMTMKITSQAYVRKNKKNNFFVTNTDSYVSGSGSPIINLNTYKVEGILTAGEEDFNYDSDRKCNISYRCDMEDCYGERILRSKIFAKYLVD